MMNRIMKRLTSKIIDQFSHEAIVEIYVLDEEGNPLELYSGMPSGLTSQFLEEVLTKPLTFYCFSVVGIDETFADLLDIHRDKMSRKEFCWLTDPLPPTLVNRTATSISLSIELIDFCGVDVSVVEDSVEYVLEGSMGQAWVPGIAARYVSDMSVSDFKVIARGPKLTDIVVHDLQPSHWYHFRLCVQYAGTWVVSESRPFATLSTRPSKPSQPSVHLIMNGNDMFLNRDRVDPLIRLTWVTPNKNGQEINKYLLQVREYTYEEAALLRVPSSNRDNCIDNGNDILGEEGGYDDDDASNILVDDFGHRFVGCNWKTVYCNKLNEVVLKQPSKSSKAWGCRLKALNSHGWSDYSDPLILDFMTHPRLFQVEHFLLPPLSQDTSRTDTSCLESGRKSARDDSLRRDSSSRRRNRSLSVLSLQHGTPCHLLPPGSPAFRYAMNPEIGGVHWLTEYPDEKMSEVLEPEVEKLWAWTNINKDFIRYVVASAVCERDDNSSADSSRL